MKTKNRSSSPLPTDILVTLPELGIEVSRVAKDEAWALCPSPKHTDRDPSWSINLTTGEHNCFSCGWGGGYIDLVRSRKGWTKKEDREQAEAWVRQRGGIGVAVKKMRGVQVWEKKKAEHVDEYDLALFRDPPSYCLDERDLDLSSTEAYGVLWDDRKKHWIIPIRDPFTNELMGWQAKGKRYFANYPENIEKSRALFGYHLLGDTAYLLESPLDAVRLHTYNIDGAVASYGVHVSDIQMDLICERSDTLYVCLDNDKAGRTMEGEIWERYRRRIRLLFANYDQVQRPNYKKDFGEMEPHEIEWALDNAISALRFRP